jgi:hypothetical protein
VGKYAGARILEEGEGVNRCTLQNVFVTTRIKQVSKTEPVARRRGYREPTTEKYGTKVRVTIAEGLLGS